MAYADLRNRVQATVNAYDEELAKPIGSTDLVFFRNDLVPLRGEVNYVTNSLRSTSLFKDRADWFRLLDFAGSMHLNTFAIQAQPLDSQIAQLRAVLQLTDEE